MRERNTSSVVQLILNPATNNNNHHQFRLLDNQPVGSSMKKYHRIRNALYCLLLALTLLFFQTLIRLNNDNNDDINNQDGSPLDHSNFRFKRNILAQPSSNVQQEGPVLDFGTLEPASLAKDLFITVKTTLKYHATRVQDILDTWFKLAPDNIYFITDADDPDLQLKTGNHLVVSNCPATHSRQALCCKLAAEYDAYLRSNRSWFCHFDDDNYVNVPQLMRTLSQFDPRRDWYLGKSSTSRPIEIVDRENNEKVSFWFATGGAGFCLSKSLATKLVPYAANGKLVEIGERIRLPDDVTMGFIIEHLLKRKLQLVETFHSHLENMKSIPVDRLHEQVSLSAGSYNSKSKNVVNVKGYFDVGVDENRFKSLHCYLFANGSICRTLQLSATADNTPR